MLNINLHKEFKSKSRTVKVACEAQLEAGKITALYGESGVGKTTVLRMLAGLEKPGAGEVNLESVALMFQDNNLFENMSIQQNIIYATEHPIHEETQAMIDALGLTNVMAEKPSVLSGGQKQKAALIRTLALNKDYILLDEPFSALDDQSILKIMEFLIQQKESGKTILMVTHRKDVILKFADSVAVMGGQQGVPSELISQEI